MMGIPWAEISVSSGGWLLAFGLVWIVIGSFVMGRLFARKQVDEMIRPRDETISALRTEVKDLSGQKDVLMREILANQTQFFQEITNARIEAKEVRDAGEAREVRREAREARGDQQ